MQLLLYRGCQQYHLSLLQWRQNLEEEEKVGLIMIIILLKR